MTQLEKKIRRSQIAAAIKDGDNLSTVRKRFKVGSTTVYAACKEFGVEVLRRFPGPAQSTYKIIAILLTTNGKLMAIADKLRVTKQRISQIYQNCIAAGIPVQPR